MRAIESKEGGRDFRLTLSPLPGNRMPKRSSPVALVVDGKAATGAVTTNRAWAESPEKVLEYVWLEISGKAYYLTLDYAEKAGPMELRLDEGTAKRADPARVGKADKEAARITAFKATWAARS